MTSSFLQQIRHRRLHASTAILLVSLGSGAAAIGAEAPAIVARDAAPASAEPERRDLWHEPWAFAMLVALLSAEWILRRRSGLR